MGVRKFTAHLLSPESLKPKRQTQQTSVQTLVYQREHLNMFVCLPDFKEPNRTTCTQNKHQFKKLSCGILDVVYNPKTHQEKPSKQFEVGCCGQALF